MKRRFCAGAAMVVCSLTFALSAHGRDEPLPEPAMSEPAPAPAPQPATEPASQPTTRPLAVGDVAPALEVDRWLKGEPVAKFEAGKIYVVDFWATWCGPCVASMPDVSFLQAKYPEVTFIGVDVEEKFPDDVDRFMRRIGRRMNYRVAADLSPGKYEPGPMYNAWMFSPVGERGLPDAFVIGRDGKLLVTGHPSALDGVLQAVVEDRFDRDVYNRAEDHRDGVWKTYNAARERKDYVTARAALDQLIAVSPYNSKYAYAIQKIYLLLNSGDVSGADAECDRVIRGGEAGDALPTAVNEALLARIDVLAARRDVAGLNAHLAQLRKHFADDGVQLNQLAWKLVSDSANHGLRALPIDMDVVLAIANDANIDAIGEDPNALDTLARVHALRGEFEMAARTEQLALDLVSADQKDKRNAFEQTRNAYRDRHVD